MSDETIEKVVITELLINNQTDFLKLIENSSYETKLNRLKHTDNIFSIKKDGKWYDFKNGDYIKVDEEYNIILND
jgi:hypothetical protein